MAFVVLFALLFAQVAYVQVVAADRIANQPGNAARQIRAEYQTERGSDPGGRRPHDPGRERRGAARDRSTGTSGATRAATLYGQHHRATTRGVFGRAGLEQAMNPYLSGTAPELAAANLTDLILGRPKEGGTVVTTIVPSAAAGGARTRWATGSGAVVAIDSATGDVLAMWSNPGYDPTLLSVGTSEEMTAAWDGLNADPEKPLLSKAFQELYLPGSTFKLVTVVRRARERLPARQTLVRTRTCSTCRRPTTTCRTSAARSATAGRRTVTMAEAFEESCNVTFGEVGLELGAERLSSQAFDYGLCQTFPPDETGLRGAADPVRAAVRDRQVPRALVLRRAVPALAYSAVGLDNDL